MSISFILIVYGTISSYYHRMSVLEKSEKKVPAYRTHMNIIGDILLTTRDEIEVEEGASVTYLIRKANVSHVRISKILHNLVSQGLLEQKDTNGALRYVISPSGREFLLAYHTFRKFAENFGLVI